MCSIYEKCRNDKIRYNFSGTSPQKLTNYKFNVPKERITFVQAGKRQRKNEANMSDTEKGLFVAGITYFNSNDNSNAWWNFRQMVAIHRMNHRIHTMDGPSGTQRFLPWHRVYLAALEYWIRFKFDSNFFIPYWDWIKNPSIPDWLANFTPTVNIPNVEVTPPNPTYFDTETVTRTPGLLGKLPTKQNIDNLYNYHTYTEFTLNLEVLHGMVHTWVGGPMIRYMDLTCRPTVLATSCQYR